MTNREGLPDHMLNNLTDQPVEYVVEVPGWLVALKEALVPLLIPATVLGISLIAIGLVGIVRHRRARRAATEAEHVPATTDH